MIPWVPLHTGVRVCSGNMGPGSFQPRVVMAPSRFGPESFWPGSFWPNLVGVSA